VSDHLGITLVAATQNQKEVTINDAVNILDRSGNSDASIAMTDANLTLTAAQVRQNGLITLTGTLTAARVLTIPAGKRQVIVRNLTTGGFTLEIGYAAGTRATIPSQGSITIQADGTNCHAVGATAEIRSFSAGVPGAAAKITGVLFSRREVILAGAAGSRARADVAATASATFTMLKNGVSFGTFNFAAAASTATFTAATDTIFDVGDRLTITAPSPADATLADVFVTLRARFT